MSGKINVNAIIAEYNPFHMGHKLHLENAIKRNNADYTIIIMSGNFVQRGAPAMLNKFVRAKMALMCGADLVLELPAAFSASSAEFFASGAVALADKIGVVNHLCFGSECGDTEVLTKIARIFLDEPAAYTESLKLNLKTGLSYPLSRTNAIISYDPSLSDCRSILSTPNNILGIEYIKALLKRNSAIIPDTTLRVGTSYHDMRFGGTYTSSHAIRVAIAGGNDPSFLKGQVPECVYDILIDGLNKVPMMTINDFSESLYYKLINERSAGYSKYFDVSPALSDRIANHLNEYKSFTGFCDLLKSKDMTYARISRCLLHILLGMTDETFNECRNLDYTPYARVLGFKKESSPLMSEIKKNSQIPLITKLADANKILPANSMQLLKNELRMNDIYLSAAALKTRRNMESEYSTPIVIV